MLEILGQENLSLSFKSSLVLTFGPHNEYLFFWTSVIPLMLVISFTFSLKKATLGLKKNRLLKRLFCLEENFH